VSPRHADRLPGKEIAVHEGHELGMLLRKAYLSFHRRANSWMLEHGVTADQFVLLTVVAREPGIAQISIVERTSSDPNTVAAVLRRLEQRRLVRREAHGHDRRRRCVFLTAEGRRVQERTAEDAEPILAALSDCMADGDRMPIERFLRGVHRAFSAPPAEANGRPTRRATRRGGTT
jgi:DNA-binding MarR family transcriptional regulator